MSKFTAKKIALMAQSVLRGGKHYGEHNMMHPVRDWLTGFSFFLLMVVIGAWWAYSVYVKYQDVSAFNIEVAATGDSSYRASLVAAALKELRDRKAAYETIEARLQSLPVVALEAAMSSSTDGNREEEIATTSSETVEELDAVSTSTGTSTEGGE